MTTQRVTVTVSDAPEVVAALEEAAQRVAECRADLARRIEQRVREMPGFQSCGGWVCTEERGMDLEAIAAIIREEASR